MYDLSKIGRLHIELTNRCNASCPACSRNICGGPVIPNLKLTQLSIDDIKQFFPVDFAKNISAINFCGNLGDSGMAVDLLPILKYFQYTSEKNIVQQVRTNGGMRKPEYWKEVGDFFASIPNNRNVDEKDIFSVSAVVFSVDGLEDTNHIYRRGVRWDRLFANMEAYASTGATGIWEFLVFEHNQHQLEEAKKIADDLGFILIFKNPLGFGENEGNLRGLKVYDRNEKYEYSVYPVNFIGKRDYLIPENFQGGEMTKAYNKYIPVLSEHSKELAKNSCIKCRSVDVEIQELYVSAEGYLLPCCFLGGAFGNQTTYSRWQFNTMIRDVGLDKFDLRKNNILQILKGPYFQKFFLDGWEDKPVEEGRLLFCAEVCGGNTDSTSAGMDKLYRNRQKT